MQTTWPMIRGTFDCLVLNALSRTVWTQSLVTDGTVSLLARIACCHHLVQEERGSIFKKMRMQLLLLFVFFPLTSIAWFARVDETMAIHHDQQRGKLPPLATTTFIRPGGERLRGVAVSRALRHLRPPGDRKHVLHASMIVRSGTNNN